MAEIHSERALPEQLLHPDAYPAGVSSVKLVETHISWVFLTDQQVYKVKKPVRFPFLDYGTLEARKHACEEEVRLNRRLAPRTYLTVEPIVRTPDGKIRVGGVGDAVEYCVVMHRLPLDQCLDKRVARGEANGEDIDRLLDVVLPFYRNASVNRERADHASAEAVLHNVRDNLDVLENWCTTASGRPSSISIARIASSQLLFVHAQHDLFDRRIREGFVCDGHGDLRPEHVCMLDPPVVFDCIEFSESLRIGDVVSELAFLAMELERLGRADLATRLMEEYRRRSGDTFSPALASFYKAYRASVRAKVDVLRAGQLPETNRLELAHEIERYLQLASFHASEFYRPILAITVGASGTGKSTVAETLAKELAFKHLRTDTIRAQLAGGRAPGEIYGEGKYSSPMTDKVYETLFEQAKKLLSDAGSVVLDGTFREKRFRESARELARRMGAEFLLLHCRCDPEIAEHRILERMERGSDPSDARPDFHRRQLEEMADADDLRIADALVLDTSSTTGQVLFHVVDRIRQVLRLG